MKELSIEEKAKAYDGVREKIAIRFGSNVADEIFSQFEMSEDERIRKELIFYFQEEIPQCSIQEHSDKMKEFISWLKRREVERTKLELKAGNSYFCYKSRWERADSETFKKGLIYKCNKDGVLDNFVIKNPEQHFIEIKDERIAWIEKQGEQSISHDDEIMIEQLTEYFTTGHGLQNTNGTVVAWLNDVKKKLEKQGEKPDTDFSDLRTWKYISDYVLTKWCGIGQYLDNPYLTTVAEELQKKYYLEQKQGEQKPTDKVEPKFKVGDIISNGISEVKIVSIDKNNYNVTNGEIENDAHAGNWVVYFKDQDNWKLKEQNSVWSEEDESNLDSAIYFIRREPYHEHDAEPIVDWLRTLKERYTWKPSDEQMRVLDLAIRCGINRGTTEETTLVSLFNDLKKLIKHESQQIAR